MWRYLISRLPAGIPRPRFCCAGDDTLFCGTPEALGLLKSLADAHFSKDDSQNEYGLGFCVP